MNVTTRVQGASEVSANLRRAARELKREIPSLLKQQARAACVNLCYHTLPFGFSEDLAAKFRITIAADIRSIYVDRDAISAITELIKPRSERLAMAFWAASKKGDLRRANKYLRDAGIRVEMVDRSFHRAARTPRGQVVRRKKPDQLVRKASLGKYVKEKQGQAGLAKAGWYAAAKALGGRVRTNSVGADGARSTSETIPAYVRKVARRYPGSGGAIVTDRKVIVYSNIRYAFDAFGARTVFDDVVSDAQESFRAAIDVALTIALNRRDRRIVSFRRRRAA